MLPEHVGESGAPTESLPHERALLRLLRRNAAVELSCSVVSAHNAWIDVARITPAYVCGLAGRPMHGRVLALHFTGTATGNRAAICPRLKCERRDFLCLSQNTTMAFVEEHCSACYANQQCVYMTCTDVCNKIMHYMCVTGK